MRWGKWLELKTRPRKSVRERTIAFRILMLPVLWDLPPAALPHLSVSPHDTPVWALELLPWQFPMIFFYYKESHYCLLLRVEPLQKQITPRLFPTQQYSTFSLWIIRENAAAIAAVLHLRALVHPCMAAEHWSPASDADADRVRACVPLQASPDWCDLVG